MRIQILKKDKEEALDMYGEAVENLHKLRESLATAESLRDKVRHLILNINCTARGTRCGFELHRMCLKAFFICGAEFQIIFMIRILIML